MKEPNTIFQTISVHRRIFITVGMFAVLIIVTGLYGLIAIVEMNKRLHETVIEGQKMVKAIDAARSAQVHFKKQVQEWKNILLRGNDREMFERYVQAFNEEDRRVNEYLQSLSGIAATTGLSIPEIANVVYVHKQLGNRYRDALKEYEHGDLKSAVVVDKMIRGIDREPTDQIDALVGRIMTQADKRLRTMEAVARTQLEAYESLSFFLIFLVLAGVCFGIFNARSILRDLPPEENGNGPEREDPRT